jgi:hypothetical protein
MTSVVIYNPTLHRPKRSGVLKLDSLAIYPGKPNYLSDSQVRQLKAHPDFPRLKEWGALKLTESDNPAEPLDDPSIPEPSPEPPADLSGYDVRGKDGEVGADDVVAATVDVALLQQWLAAESRVTLKRILQERIEDLQTTPGGDLV